MDQRDRVIVLLGLLLLTAALYSPLLYAPFVFEDGHQFAPAVWTIPGRALTAWSWTWTPTPTAAHAVNIALHLVNGTLVWLLGSMLVPPVAALSLTGLFLLMPLNSEAVAYASARGDLLVTLFTLAAVWLALQWVDRAGWWRGALSGVAVIGAALSKEIGLFAVPLVMLTLYLTRQRRPSAVFVLNGLWLASGVVLGATWWRVSTWLVVVEGQSVFNWPTFARLQLATVWHLVALSGALWGFSLDHDALALSHSWQIASVACTAITVLIGIVAIWRAPLVAWAIAWVGICVAPRFVFASYEFLKEYQFYTASVGLCLVLVLIARRLAGMLRVHPLAIA